MPAWTSILVLQRYSFAKIRVSYAPMEIIYFTAAGIILYVAADWILKRMETAAGKRFQYRSLIFFVILLTMAVTSFAIIRQLAG
jgi:hypothetical protein